MSSASVRWIMTPVLAAALMVAGSSGAKAARKTKKKSQPREEEAVEKGDQEIEQDSGKSKGGIGDRLKGMFGF